ncbi:MAG: glycogen debranching enzyme N-terminal domain-containing protein, partial [Gemmataceae bacterium]
MNETRRHSRWTGDVRDAEQLIQREWLVTNGLGGYASGTVVGVSTRRYHGLLIASLPAPPGRFVMLNHLREQVRLPNGRTLLLGGVQHAHGAFDLHGVEYFRAFHLEYGLPVWRWRIEDWELEKRLLMVHEQNTTHINYRLIAGQGTMRLKLRLGVHFRPHEAKVSPNLENPYALTALGDRYEVREVGSPLPPLRLHLHGRRAAFTVEGQWTQPLLYREEEARGYDSRGELWSPGFFRIDLSPEHDATLAASTESWETMEARTPETARQAEHERRRRLLALAHPAARTGSGGEWTLAADPFLIAPVGRIDEARTVIAGYPWFTDWGRDTMISLEGLTLVTW